MRDVELRIPPEVADFMRQTIRRARGNEVFFLGRVAWDAEARVATLGEVDVMARGGSASVIAIIDRAEEWDVALHNHPGGALEPSDADNDVAHELATRSVGFAIIDNDARRHYLVVPPFHRKSGASIDLEQVRHIFSHGGALAGKLDDYETREAQIEMALEVARSLNEGQVVACEAGTGVGKSFAYLIPAILWAVANRERVVVSTGTINLQEQLVGKDLPLLKKVLDVDFAYALIKGRGNYACRRKLAQLPQEMLVSPPSPEEQRVLEDLIAWGETTRDGSRADLAWSPPPEAWERVMSETDKSLKVNCAHYQDCFYYQAKRRTFKAQIVVANHHLFFADLSVRRKTGDYKYDLVLPGYSRVVFDEAHHLEDVASEHFGFRFSRRGIRQRLSRMRSKDGQKGMLVVLVRKLEGWGDKLAAATITQDYGDRLPDLAERIDEQFEEIEECILQDRGGGALGPGVVDLDALELRQKIRHRPEGEDRVFWELIRQRLAKIRGELERVSRHNDDALKVVGAARIPERELDTARLDLEAFGKRLEPLLADFDRFCDFADDSLVRWIDPREAARAWRPGEVGFAAAPIRVANALGAALYEPIKTVLLTSATLSVEGNTRFLGDRLGFSLLPEERFTFRTFDSPFDFYEQVLTVVPTDVPAPQSPEYATRLPALILDLLRASGGRAFVLFTSYRLLRQTYAACETEISAMGFRPLAQGQAQRSELLHRFRTGANSVLFGTDSFWEGVDVKGRALECVIITRLPFRVPSEPLQEARLEDVEARGLNSFIHYTVPQAVLRLKQGFGRLVRSTEDRGVVAILDRRVLTKRYGKTFLGSLPRTRIVATSAARVVETVTEFFAAHEQRVAKATSRDGDGPEDRDAKADASAE